MTPTVARHQIHVHHHGGDTDRLLVDAVRPLLLDLDRLGCRPWFVRHWRRGPHVRLVVRADESTLRERVLPAVGAHLDGPLAARSVTRVDLDAVLPLHRRLAELELDDGPLTPWHPDNSWHVEPYDDRLAVHGTAEASQLTADFLHETNMHAFTLVGEALARGDGGRRAAVFDIMVLLADRLAVGGLPLGHLSYRSHAQAYLAQAPDGDRRRRTWDDYHRSHGGELSDRIDALLGPTGDAHPAHAFVSAVGRYQEWGRNLWHRGLLPLGDDEQAEPDRVAAMAGLSPFHQALVGNDTWWNGVRTSAEFAGYRLALNLMYLQFTRAGLVPEHRYLLCHLVARTVESRTGRDAVDVVRAFGDGTVPG
ncbi:thiopeptide maturation pyridine synthase [Micromonospora echinospora]|uniref:thiopeptide maturation pyridine synthase n=1 Tax=Micromonospora echinospora TaxID=1877 RepID=UPI003670B330